MASNIKIIIIVTEKRREQKNVKITALRSGSRERNKAQLFKVTFGNVSRTSVILFFNYYVSVGTICSLPALKCKLNRFLSFRSTTFQRVSCNVVFIAQSERLLWIIFIGVLTPFSFRTGVIYIFWSHLSCRHGRMEWMELFIVRLFSQVCISVRGLANFRRSYLNK